MIFTGLNHRAFITPDIEKTIRFYRDLLEMPLVAGIGHDGYRHYLFQIGDGAVAFFAYDGAKAMAYDKFHGAMTEESIGYDHVSFTVPSGPVRPQGQARGGGHRGQRRGRSRHHLADLLLRPQQHPARGELELRLCRQGAGDRGR